MDRPNDRVEDDPLAVRILKAPWSPIVLGFCVFWITSFLFHERIVLDRGLDVLTRGGRVVCKLSEVTKVELEDYFRIRVMNGMALLLSDGRRFSLLLYDGRADDGLKAAAQQVAEFAGASVEFKVGGSLFRDKKK